MASNISTAVEQYITRDEFALVENLTEAQIALCWSRFCWLERQKKELLERRAFYGDPQAAKQLGREFKTDKYGLA